MENLLGLLRIRVRKGVNLAVRDARTSDPYIVITMGDQKLKTSVVRKSCNPEWNDELTLSMSQPDLPIKLTVYDHDTFTVDDQMGDAAIDIKPFLHCVRMHIDNLPNDTLISNVIPSRENCLAEESCIFWEDGKITQDMCLRLRNVECGEVDIQLQWINLPGSRGL